MEPNDPQLRDLLREWKTPALSSEVEQKILSGRRSWASFLLYGSIRVPLPVVYCLLAVLIFAGWRVSTREPQSKPCFAQAVPNECSHAVSGVC